MRERTRVRVRSHESKNVARSLSSLLRSAHQFAAIRRPELRQKDEDYIAGSGSCSSPSPSPPSQSGRRRGTTSARLHCERDKEGLTLAGCARRGET